MEVKEPKKGKLVNDNPPHIFTAEEHRKGARKSAETRRRKKDLKNCLIELMNQEIGKDGEGNPITGVEAMAIKAFKSACNGNTKFWELVRDTAGMKPVEKVAVSEVDEDTFNELQELIEETEKD